MFIISITYKKPLEIVEKYLSDHTDFLDHGYQKNYFIVSGRKNPRTGGIIFSQLKSREQLEELIKQDPFYIHAIADYEVIEFTPTKCHSSFSAFIENKNL